MKLDSVVLPVGNVEYFHVIIIMQEGYKVSFVLVSFRVFPRLRSTTYYFIDIQRFCKTLSIISYCILALLNQHRKGNKIIIFCETNYCLLHPS